MKLLKKYQRNLAAVAPLIIISLNAQAATIVVANANDSGPGSLRQAIADANAGDTINFAPGAANIALSSVLPVNKANLTIDASALRQAATVGYSGKVGVGADGVADSGDEPTISGTPLPGVFITSATTGDALLRIEANNVTIRGLGFIKNPSPADTHGIQINIGVSGTTLDQLVVGSSSATAMTDAGNNDGRFVQCVRDLGAGRTTVSNSTLGFCRYFSYLDSPVTYADPPSPNNNVSMTGNTFYATGRDAGWNAESIAIHGIGYVIERNYFNNQSTAGGTDIYGAQQVTIRNNSYINNFTLDMDDDEAGSIIVRGYFDGFPSPRAATDITIIQNLITGGGSNFAAGVAVQGTRFNSFGDTLGAYRVTISKNSLYANGGGKQGLGINLYSDVTNRGVTPNTGALDPTVGNHGMNYPILTEVEILGNSVRVRGYVGIQPGSPAFAGSTVELFYAHNVPADQSGEIEAGDGLTVPHGEGAIYLGALTADGNGTFSGTLPLSSAALNAWQAMAGHPPQVGDVLTSTATLTSSTSEFGPNFAVTRVTTPESVPSLSWAGLGLLTLVVSGFGWRRRRMG